MKARLIELKKLEGSETDLALDYRELLMGQLNRVDPKAGLSYQEIETRLALRKSLRESGDTWIVEPPTWEQLKTLLSTERWQVISENLMQFIGDVNNAPETEIGAKDGLKLVKET